MYSHLRAVWYLLVTTTGLALLYSALAHPPLVSSVLANAIILTDSGVHLNPDGTIDYYKRDTKHLFKYARLVFVVATGIGLGLLANGGRGLWKYAQGQSTHQPTAVNESNAE